MYVDTQSILTLGAVLGAISTIIAFAWKLFAWINHQKEQDKVIETQGKEIKAVDKKYDERLKNQQKDFDSKLSEFQANHQKEAQSIQEEQTLIVYGLLACLCGLREKGCNGPVTEAIDKIEKYINQKAHDSLP